MPYLYAPFVIPPTKENVVHGTIMYISNKHYDQPVGDIIPMMLANCLKINFCILNVMQERKFEFKNVYTLSHTNRTLTILRSGDDFTTVIIGAFGIYRVMFVCLFVCPSIFSETVRGRKVKFCG